MRTLKFISGALAIVALAGGTSWASVTAAELRALLSGGERVTVVDVRGENAFAEAHIPGAINVPLAVVKEKNLPPLGRVVVCGDSVDTAETARAALILSQKPGINAEPLLGGFDSWAAAGMPDTRRAGLSEENLKHVKAEDVNAMTEAGDFVVVDLRSVKGSAKTARSLSADFPKAKSVLAGPGKGSARSTAQAGSFGEMVRLGREGGQLLVLVDDGDGESEALARRLKSAGVPRVAIVAGGELGLSR